MANDSFAAGFACQEYTTNVRQKMCRKEGRKSSSEGEHGPDGRADRKSVVGKVFMVFFN